MSGTVWCADMNVFMELSFGMLYMVTRYCNESDAKDAVRKLHNYRIRLS